MNTHNVTTLKRWVLGTVNEEGVRCYLHKVPQKIRYVITEDITVATKTATRKVAALLLENYYHDMGTDIQFVPVPIEIEYRLIEE